MIFKKFTGLFIFILELLLLGTIQAQDIEQITKAKWFTVSGGAGANGSGYTSHGMSNRRDPFAYSISANLNLNFKGIIDAPFSLYFASENKTFNAPAYNFVGISPRYKWMTAHIGSRNMNMSQYTYAGTTFVGGGIELMPENFIVKGKAFYGRLIKAVPVGDTLSPIIRQPVYERWGGAGMITIGTQSNNVDIIFFKGKDNIHSLDVVADSISVKPEENMVFGLNTKQKVGEHLLLSLEYGFSAYTRDIRQPDVVYDKYTYANNFGGLFRPKASSQYAHAWNIKADYQSEFFTVGIAFQRIDPNYQTMGALYMTNNVQNISANTAVKLLQNKINVSGSFGYQRNNLDNNAEATDEQIISSLNFSYAITDNLNASLNFSNYNTSTEAVQILIKDSIKYAQINNNLSVNASYAIPGEVLRHSLEISFVMQNVNTIDNEFTEQESADNQMSGLNAGYRLGFVETDWNIGVNASANQNKMATGNDVTSSIGVSLNKGFFKKKLQTTLGFTAMFSNSGTTSNNVNTTRLTLSYRFLKKHSVNFNTNYLHRITNTERDGKKIAGEWIGTLTYSFAF
ncbi:MAG: hypothetical protein LBS55_10335 [Prevotellaceae bacterium]|jgi:hypothetical protein|nr:hypothetical protein [Prevotellaceae bacterium]